MKRIMYRDECFNTNTLINLKNTFLPYYKGDQPINYHRPIYNNMQPTPIYYVEEEWVQISKYLPIVDENYYISNYGRVFSNYGKNMLVLIPNNKGYYRVTLNHKDNTKKAYLINRLVCICFKYTPDYKKLVSNHINGDHTDNHIWNLEWCTYSENNLHAIQSGNRNIIEAEKSHNATFTDEEVRLICLYISKNYETNDILRLMKLDINKINQNIISNIYNRRIWTSVSKDYKFPEKEKRQYSSNRQFDEFIIKKICECLEKEMKFKDICKELNIEYNDSVRVIIGQIRNGKKYTEISKDYNIPRDKSLKLTNEQLHQICKGICENKETGEILNSIGLDFNDSTRTIVYNIKMRRKHKNISKDYIW